MVFALISDLRKWIQTWSQLYLKNQSYFNWVLFKDNLFYREYIFGTFINESILQPLVAKIQYE
jgi:hypothetical protein